MAQLSWLTVQLRDVKLSQWQNTTNTWLLDLSFEASLISWSSFSSLLINTRHMRTRGYGSWFVCLFVCYQSTASLRHLCNTVNIPANFSPGFQLRDFAVKLSFTSYSFIAGNIAKVSHFSFTYLCYVRTYNWRSWVWRWHCQKRNWACACVYLLIVYLATESI